MRCLVEAEQSVETLCWIERCPAAVYCVLVVLAVSDGGGFDHNKG